MAPVVRRALVALALLAVAAPVEGQRRPPPGWIGVSFEVTSDRRSRSTRVEITDVNPGSPAAEAGIRAGDRLLRVNDLRSPSELGELAERLRLRAGDRVRMVVERDGRRREFDMRAAERPVDFTPSQELTLAFEPDSLVETMVQAMESLRVRMVERQGSRTEIVVAPRATDARGVVAAAPPAQVSVQAPFEFFIFRGEAHDSLSQEMDRLNRDISELERRLERRNTEIRRESGARVTQARLAQDEEARRLQAEIEQAARQTVRLRSAMADAARENASVQYSAPQPPRARRATVWQPENDEFRPLTPYLLGSNRVAGAEIIDLRPELASYFDGVEDGVLVVDVAPRTPAAMSGIVPGDVITRMDQVVVRSVDDLRFGVSQAGETLPITLIRKGTRIQILLRR